MSQMISFEEQDVRAFAIEWVVKQHHVKQEAYSQVYVRNVSLVWRQGLKNDPGDCPGLVWRVEVVYNPALDSVVLDLAESGTELQVIECLPD